MSSCQPMHKAWDELVWQPPSSASPMPKWNKPVSCIQGQTVEMGPMMLPTQFHMSNPMGEFKCFTWGLIYKGAVLTYDPVTNSVE